ncbi:hypothetical protein Syun_026535 [Stephania yunnanensis]|uniref:Uncharacterized protein n=1 Tax=Stephania yunnanensis TaxID=152371 RepID=A0AAP0ETS6_9MAGN
MPLRSDGSLCVVDPFKRSSSSSSNGGDWSPSNEREIIVPKLEDYLGGGYANSSSHDHHHHHHHHEPMFLHESTHHHQHHHHESPRAINMNIPFNAIITNGSSSSRHDDNDDDHDDHHDHHADNNSLTLLNHEGFHNHYSNNSIYPSHHHVTHLENATSISGFKSWLRQAPFTPSSSSTHEKSLSLSMISTAVNASQQQEQQELLISSDDRKRNQIALHAKSASKESVPRKSIDTFGQRTSQYRGVTRWVKKN